MAAKSGPRVGERAGAAGEHTGQQQHTPHSIDGQGLADLLLTLLAGYEYAAAMMPWRTPGPIRLPGDEAARRELVEAHIGGAPATVTYCPAGRPEQKVRVPALVLLALCPDADGLCRWCAIDLDAADGHGAGGLVDPAHAGRCVAERAAELGLLEGLMVATSRGGKGRHVWLIPPWPVALDDGVLALAALIGYAYQVAERDVRDYATPHAFRNAKGTIARPGRSGALELVPHSTTRPARGWAMCLPGAGAYALQGGSLIVEPFTGSPITLASVPRCDPDAWAGFVESAHAQRPRPTGQRQPRSHLDRRNDQFARIDPRTREFLDGKVPEGGRAKAAFPASCNLLGCGFPPHQAERLILRGAADCGLPEREARSAFRSAVRRNGCAK